MNAEGKFPNAIKFVSIMAPKIKQFAIEDTNGSEIYVYAAETIRLFSKYLGVRYEVLTPPDGAVGSRASDGNWTGMLGMIQRSEAHFGIVTVALTEERYTAMNYSFPHFQSKLTFMTDKPQPISKNLAVVHPFTIEVWMVLLVVLVLASFIFYLLMNRRKSYEIVALNVLGNLFEQSISFNAETHCQRIFLTAWLLGIVIIANSYKGLLLSFLSFPTMVGIRDFSDLSKAAVDDSFTCISFKDTYLSKTFLQSKEESWKAIGRCLQRSHLSSFEVLKAFFETPQKKAFISSEVVVQPYWRQFFISDDYFNIELCAIPISENFCCLQDLNRFLFRLLESGITRKLIGDQQFFLQFNVPYLDSNPSEVSKIKLEDFSGVFFVLMFGWLLAFMTLLAEIVLKKIR